MEVTSTSRAAAAAATRAPRWTAIPRGLAPRGRSTSPVCTPVRTSRPSSPTSAQIASAQWMARRPVERGEKAVPCGIDLLAVKPLELPADDRVMPLEQLRPTLVAELVGALRRRDEIGEQNRRENAIRQRRRSHAGEELLDRVDRVRHEPREVLRIGRRQHAGSRDTRRDERPLVRVCLWLEHERRRLDGPQDGSDVDVDVAHDQIVDRARCRPCPIARDPPPTECRIGAWRERPGATSSRRSPTPRRAARRERSARRGVDATDSPAARATREGAEQHERRGALRIRRREDGRDGTSSQNANSAARSLSAASITARTSSIRVSTPPSADGRSDNPVPRLSNLISRANDPSRSRNRA